MRAFFACIYMACSTLLFAGEAIFSGQGTISSRPEFARFDITIQSQCYVSPEEARLANDNTASDIQKLLGAFLADGSNKMTTTTSYISGFYDYYYDSTLEKTVNVCQNTFQKKTVISLKVDLRNDFSLIYNGIQNDVLPLFSRVAQGRDTPTTFVTINSPWAGITQKTRRALELKARENAAQNAEDNFFASIGRWNTGMEVRIVRITDGENGRSGYTGARGYQGPQGPQGPRGHQGAEGPTAPEVILSFEDILISADVTITFAFADFGLVVKNPNFLELETSESDSE